MFLVGIDIGKLSHMFCILDASNKLSHMFCILDASNNEVIVKPVSFKNDKLGFDFLMNQLKSYPKDHLLIGMEDTGHYHFTLLKFLLDSGFSVALINPVTTMSWPPINAGKATGSLRSTALIFMSRNVLPASITTSRNS